MVIYPYNLLFLWLLWRVMSEERKKKMYIIQDVYCIFVYVMNCIFLTEVYRSVVINLLSLHPLYPFLIHLIQVVPEF